MKGFFKDWLKLFFWLTVIVLVPFYLLSFIVNLFGFDPMRDVGAFKIIGVITYIPNMIFMIVGISIMFALSLVFMAPAQLLFGDKVVEFLSTKAFICAGDSMLGCMFPGVGGFLIFSFILVLFLKTWKFLFWRNIKKKDKIPENKERLRDKFIDSAYNQITDKD